MSFARFFSAAAVIVISIAASSLQAAPTVSVVSKGINLDGNRAWSVVVDPDDAILVTHPVQGFGGSLAVELALRISGAELNTATVNAAAWPRLNPGHNPFTGMIGGGLQTNGGGSTTGGIPGDYNQNGAVGADDYPVWRDSLGEVGILTADGDGSGSVDENDYQLWAANYGNTAAGGFEPAGNTIFAALGSDFFHSGAPVELMQIVTLGAGPTTVAWGSLAGAPYMGGNIIAQGGLAFVGTSGTITSAPEPSALVLAMIVTIAGAAVGNGRSRLARRK